MMLRRISLVGAFAILGAVAFASNAGAQTAPVTQDFDFGGTIGGVCTFSNTQNGTLAQRTTNASFVEAATGIFGGAAGTPATTTINCTANSQLTVGLPLRVAAPASFVETARQALVIDATGNATSATNTTAAVTPMWGTNLPTTPLLISANTPRPLRVAMAAGVPNSTGLPAGTYTYRVSVTATPN